MSVLDSSLRERDDRQKEDINTWLPCKVVRWDPDQQQVDVQPLIKRRVYVEDDLPVDESRPVIVNCPVQFAGDDQVDLSYTIRVDGPGGVRATCGIVFFCQDSLEDYLSGDGTQEVGPYEYQKHSITDGVFVPGVLPFARKRKAGPVPENGIRMQASSVDGTQILKLELDLGSMTAQLSTPARIVLESDLVEVRAEDFVYAKPDGSGALRLNRDGEWVP